MEQLLEFDYRVFFLINRDWTNGLFDFVLPIIRNKYFWSPLYVFLIAFFITNYQKNSAKIISLLLLTFFVSNILSSEIIKPFFERLRPCNEPLIRDQVRSLIACGSGYSFTSSHAANHFSIACFLIFFFYDRYKWILPVGVLWAGSISYAQVYVGVHYPVDIACGAVLGATVGLSMCWILKNKVLHV